MPACIDKNIKEAYDDYFEEISSVEEAEDVAEILLKDPSVHGKIDLRSCHQGRKRHPGFGRTELAPLPDCKRNSSDKIRKIVALRYSGYSDSRIQKTLGLSDRYIRQIEVLHPKAFEIAKQELIKNAVAEYEANVAFCRAALSEIGLRAVKTLSTVMEDTSAKQNVRLRAAETVMKLLVGSTPREKNIAEGVIDKMGDFVQKVAQSSRQNPSYIHNIEDAEVVEEDNGKTLALGG